MPEYAPSPVKVGGVIPHFFFDAIGRIVPGTFLAVALRFAGLRLEVLLPTGQYIEKDAGSLIVSVFLLFLVLYFLGFLLGALSYLLVERPWGKWRPWRLEDLRQRFGRAPGDRTILEDLFEQQFGYSLAAPKEEQHIRIMNGSWLCAYYVWANSQALGVLTSRWDAEALLSRSTLVGSVFPLAWSLSECKFSHAAAFFLIGLLAYCAYGYHRNKQVFARFDLYLALAQRRQATHPEPNAS